MRGVFLVLGAALLASAAFAQTETPAPTPAPVTTQAGPPTFAPPPDTIAVPNGRTAAAATAAKGNIARWRNSERRRLGVFARGRPADPALVPQRAAAEQQCVNSNYTDPICNNLPYDGSIPDRAAIADVGGYFMAVTDAAPLRAGAIGYGTWRDRSSAMESPSSVLITLVEGSARCGATSATIDIANVVYLGATLDPQWLPVAAAMRGTTPPAADPVVAWSELTAGVVDRERLINAWPRRALASETPGTAHLACAIGSLGELSCGVTSEEPADMRFGEAGTIVASSMRVASLTKRGENSAGVCTSVDIVFGINENHEPTIRARTPAS